MTGRGVAMRQWLLKGTGTNRIIIFFKENKDIRFFKYQKIYY